MRTELLRLSDVVGPQRGLPAPPRGRRSGRHARGRPLRHQVLAVLGARVSNAVRHAGATSIDVEVRASLTEGLVVRVVDDGQGLRGRAPRGGLLNMAHRAEGLGGSCVVRDRPTGASRCCGGCPERRCDERRADLPGRRTIRSCGRG